MYDEGANADLLIQLTIYGEPSPPLEGLMISVLILYSSVIIPRVS